MISPPRSAELVLESFGAPASFREPLLGDLAEGFALRVEHEGADAARRWYLREAMRAVPHLVRAWAGQLGWGGVRRLASLLLASYFLTLILVFVLMRMALAVTGLVGDDSWLPLGLSHAVLAVLGFIGNLVAGYLAAWLDEGAPMSSAVAMGVAMSGITLASAMITGAEGWTVGWPLLPVVAAFVAPVLGGLHHVRARGRDEAAPARSH